MLKIDATGLQPVALGNSDDARVGEWVLAIGNPLGEGLTFTVTSGIVSAKGRALNGLPGRGQGSIQDFIQTDAAINPGNSGGPLVNVRGEVIGINSAIASETGYYSGYGFAIPINLARTVMNQLITSGKVHRAALGVSIADVSLKTPQYVGLPEIRGVVVKDIPSTTRRPRPPASSRATSSSPSTASRWSTWASCSRWSASEAGRHGQGRGRAEGRRAQDRRKSACRRCQDAPARHADRGLAAATPRPTPPAAPSSAGSA